MPPIFEIQNANVWRGDTLVLRHFSLTHHPGEIPPEIQRVILLKNGRVFAEGSKQSTITRALLSELYEVELRVKWSAGWCDVRPG